MLVGLWSCTGMDEGYKEFIKNGEISYTGKIDSLHIYGGKNRLNVKGLIISDPKVTEVRIFWNTGKDSTVVPIVRTSGVDTLDVIIDDLEENIYNFEIRTYDKLGNKSVPVNKIGNTYGERYQATLTAAIMNRKVIVGINTGTNLDLTMETLNDYTKNSAYTILSYTAIDNSVKQLKVLPTEQNLIITDYKTGTDVAYKTAYLPEKNAIDEFFTPERLFSTQTDVTTTYLVNYDFETGPITPTTAYATVVDGVFAIPGWSTSTAPGTNITTGSVKSNPLVEFRKLAAVYYDSAYNTAGNVFGTTPKVTATGGSALLAIKEHWIPAPPELYVQQTITLPVGTYTLTWQSLVGQTLSGASSMMGYVMDGLGVYDGFPSDVNIWKNHSLVFTVTTPKAVTFRMGYKKTANAGGGSSPILFVDNLKLLQAKL